MPPHVASVAAAVGYTGTDYSGTPRCLGTMAQSAPGLGTACRSSGGRVG